MTVYTSGVRKIGIFSHPGSKRASASSSPQEEGRKRPLHCSFCGKSEEAVASLIVGSSVTICGDCVDVCVNLLEESGAGKEQGRGAEEKKLSTTVFPCILCGLPTPAPDLVPLPERGPICRGCIEAVCTAAGERTE